jgi:ketosteroid isomerase-like protein
MLLAGCATGAAATPPAPPVDWHAFDVRRTLDAGHETATDKERAVAESYAAALSSPGFAKLGPVLDPAAHFAFPGMPDARGREAVVRAHDALLGAFDARAITITRLWLTDSAQTLEWTMSGRQERPFEGTQPTHRTIVFRGLTILWTKDDGSVTDVHVYFDVAVVRAELGAGPGGTSSPAGRARPATESPTSAEVPTDATSGPPQTFEQTGSSEEQQSVACVRSTLDALEQSQEPAYLQAMTDDVDVVTPGRPKPTHGKDDARAYFRAIHQSIGQLDTTVDSAWGIADFAVVEYQMTGEQLAPLGGVPVQKDRVVRVHLVDVVQMRAGKIARIWRYDNPVEIASER